MKALVTAEAAEQVDVVRRACGGHGFMASSNLPRLWGLITAACTYEGENTVMLLQVGGWGTLRKILTYVLSNQVTMDDGNTITTTIAAAATAATTTTIAAATTTTTSILIGGKTPREN